MDILKINYNIKDYLFNKVLFIYKNTIKLFSDLKEDKKSKDIKNIQIKFNNKINYDVILISIISFSIIIYLLYFYNYKFYIFLIFSSIISILSDGNIIQGKKNKLLHKIDLITAFISIVGVGAILSKRVNIFVTLLIIYIGTRFLKYSRNSKNLKEWKQRHNIWHLVPLVILLIHLQVFKNI
jgi:hypothetical protein